MTRDEARLLVWDTRVEAEMRVQHAAIRALRHRYHPRDVKVRVATARRTVGELAG